MKGIYVKSVAGSARTNIPWIEISPSDSSSMIGRCRGLSEWGISAVYPDSCRNSLRVAWSFMSATTISPDDADWHWRINTRSPSSTHFWFIESPCARRKKYFSVRVSIFVDTGICVSIFSSANIGIPQAIVPMRGMLRTSTLSVWNWGDIWMSSRVSRYIHHFFMICSRRTDIERGEAYPRDVWSARIVIFSPFVRNSRIFWRANCSLEVSFSGDIVKKLTYTKYTSMYIDIFEECK